MQTETWIERTIIDQLTTHNRRYKHDYGGVEKTTDDLVAACAKLDLATSGDEPGLPSIDQFFTAEMNLEPEVETTLESLEERGLIERVGEQERLGPPLEPGDDGTTATLVSDIDRPDERANSDADAIEEALAEAGEKEARCLVVTGEGDEAFVVRAGLFRMTVGTDTDHNRLTVELADSSTRVAGSTMSSNRRSRPSAVSSGGVRRRR